MATYQSTNVQNKKAVASLVSQGGGVLVAHAEVVCSAAPSTSDTLEFFYLPANAKVIMAVLEATDMDTNVSPTLALNIGDSGVADRLFAASTVGQAATLSSAIATAGHHATYSSKTLIKGTASTNAATGAAGSVYLTVLYTVTA